MIVEFAFGYGDMVTFGIGTQQRTGEIDGVQQVRNGGCEYLVRYYDSDDSRTVEWLSEYELELKTD